MRQAIFWVVLSLLFTQCAFKYRPVHPPTVRYVVREKGRDLDYAYLYNVLSFRNNASRPNTKYAKREQKYGYQIVAVRITNKTTDTLNYSDDIEITTDLGKVQLVPNEQAAWEIRQKLWPHLFWIYANFRVDDCVFDCRGDANGSFIPLGYFLMTRNLLRAHFANTKLKQEFAEYNLYERNIKPGETVYGIIAIKSVAFQPLYIRRREE